MDQIVSPKQRRSARVPNWRVSNTPNKKTIKQQQYDGGHLRGRFEFAQHMHGHALDALICAIHSRKAEMAISYQ